MKKIFLVALVLLTVFALVGCAQPDTGPSPTTQETGETTTPTPPPSPSPSPSPSPEDQADQIGSGRVGSYDITIVDFKLSKDYEDSPAVIITYEWTNNDEETVGFMFAVDAQVFQGGVECETAIMMGDDDYDSELSMTEIKPGTTLTVQSAYVLRDTETPIEVEVTELFSFEKNPPVVKKTFEIAE